MSGLEAIILGFVQGLTEFLPVSSSGHLTIGKELLGIESSNLKFEVIVHAATVTSTIVVFYKEILNLIKGFFRFKLNDETNYLIKIAISMIPVFIIGIFFKEYVEQIFGSGLLIVGLSLLLTATLLTLTNFIKPREREITKKDAFIIGVAQAIAVLPGLSRSGATISTGMMLGVKKEEIAKFSFLMVLVPVLGDAFLELISGEFTAAASGISITSLILGFVSAFLSGLFACKVMINLVKKAKLTGFAIYCAIIGVLCLVSLISVISIYAYFQIYILEDLLQLEINDSSYRNRITTLIVVVTLSSITNFLLSKFYIKRISLKENTKKHEIELIGKE